MDVLTKFSDHRCEKALSSAFRVYQDNLPNQYTTEKHLTHVQNALSYFSNYARGPSFERYLEELKNKCNYYWENGHQVCEVKSLTNHHCVYGFHFLTEEEKLAYAGKKSGGVKPHNSKVRNHSACNCGRKVSMREDAFTLEEANIHFYADLDKKCCSKYERVYFPTSEFQIDESSATAEVSSASEEMLSGVSTKSLSGKVDKNQVIDVRALEASQSQIAGSEDSKQSPCLTLDDLSITDLAQPSNHSDLFMKAMKPVISSAPSTSSTEVKPEKTIKKQLVGPSYKLLSSECIEGYLPEQNMWSFIKYDNYSSYDSFNGLDLPGFMHGTNFLLPFDVFLLQNVDDLWPKLKSKEATKRKGNQAVGNQNQSSGFSVGTKTLRAYIGYEYECYKGTRFFLSSRESMVKGTPAGPDVAMNAIASNMPLYYQCTCRLCKNRHFAQLMRIHFIAPPNTQLSLNPIIRPLGVKEPGLSFFPQWDHVRVPPDGHWVLRLPYVYSYSKGHIQPARDLTSAGLGFVEANIVTGASFKI